MSSGDIKQVLDLLASLPDETTMSLAERRAIFNQIGQQFPMLDGISVTETVAGGVSAEWVRAENARQDAALLYLHGGGYRIGSPASHRHVAAALSQAVGVQTFVIDYRLAPESPFPAAVEDAVSSYQWLIENIAPARIVVAGDSAGGGLTLATLIALRDRNIPLPVAGVALSPWVDLTISAESYETRADVDPILTRQELISMAEDYLQGQDAATPLASPLFADLRGLPPLLIHVGNDEVLLDDGVKLGDRAKAAGVDVTIEVCDEMIHVWHFFFPFLQEGREAIARIGEFAQKQMKLA